MYGRQSARDYYHARLCHDRSLHVPPCPSQTHMHHAIHASSMAGPMIPGKTRGSIFMTAHSRAESFSHTCPPVRLNRFSVVCRWASSPLRVRRMFPRPKTSTSSTLLEEHGSPVAMIRCNLVRSFRRERGRNFTLQRAD